MGGIYSYIIPIKKYFTIPKYFDKLRSFRNARINDRNEEKYRHIIQSLLEEDGEDYISFGGMYISVDNRNNYQTNDYGIR